MSLEITQVFAFSNSATEHAPDILNGRQAAEWLKERYVRGCIFGLDNLMYHGCYKLSGWLYRFNMPKFLVKQHGNWQEYYAPNKTCLRKALYGKIDKIIKLES